MMDNSRVYKMAFAAVYPLYIRKAEKKGRSKKEVDEIIYWLTGYDEDSLGKQLDSNADLEAFFRNAPLFNPNAAKITGVICGCRIENIEDELMRKIRCLDKLIDELAKGKTMEKIISRFTFTP